MKTFFSRRRQFVGFCTILGLLLFGTWAYRSFTENSKLEESTPPDSTIKAAQVGISFGIPSYRAEFVETNDVRTTPEEIIKAHRYGALGKVTLRVLDMAGLPVPDAQVDIGFVIFDKGSKRQCGRTDRNGSFSAEDQVSWGIGWTITKDGYYKTIGNYLVQRAKDPRQLKGGRWQPWNPTIEVVLKQKEMPIKLNWKRVITYIPEHNEPVGFDCEKNDLVSPFGSGEIGDLFFDFFSPGGWESRLARRYTNELTISTGNIPGIFVEPHDVWSQQKSSIKAPESGYLDGVVLSAIATTRYRSGDINENLFEQGKHIVFRSRVAMSDTGAIISANYGKIYPEFVFGDAPPEKGRAGVVFEYCFNPEPNNRSLENDAEH